jgi:hypothetical protein
MDKPALNSLIKQRVEEAVTNVQTDMLKHMDRIKNLLTPDIYPDIFILDWLAINTAKT